MKLKSGCLLGRAVRTRAVAGLYLTEAIYSGQENLPRHAYERPFLYFVLQGSYCERYGERTIMAEPRSVVYQPADTPHSDTFHGTEVRCFHVEFTPAWDARLAETATSLNEPGFWRGGEPAWLADRLWRESRSDEKLSDLAVEGIALEWLAAVARAQRNAAPLAKPRGVDKVRDFLQSNFATSLSYDQIGREFGVPPAQLARAFRRRYGCGIGEYVRRCRVDHARRQLTETEAPLAQIALGSGFYDQAHFTRTFRRFTGMTPAGFRAMVRKG